MTGVPLSAPIVGPALAKRLRSKERFVPIVAPLIASDSLKCARRIGFRLFGTPPDIAYTEEEKATFSKGDLVDSTAAEVFAREVNGVIQTPFNWLPEVPLKGKADAGYKRTLTRVVAEVKSTSDKGFQFATGGYSAPPCPKVEWVIQAGLAACSPTIGAQWVHVVLVDSEQYNVAEWMLDVDVEYEWLDRDACSIRALVTEELQRQLAVLVLCEAGFLPARDVPGFGRVMLPPSRDEDRAEPWQCRFCPFQPSCSQLDASEVPDFGEMAS